MLLPDRLCQTEQNKNSLGKEKLIKSQLEGKLYQPTLYQQENQVWSVQFWYRFLKTELYLDYFFPSTPLCLPCNSTKMC